MQETIPQTNGLPHKNTAVQYNSFSYNINGEQVFLNSAAIHYFRMPKEEWREVLVKAKLAGMNCVDTYFAWNVHEPEEGMWSFEGNNDCGAFLDLCHELGLWVIARPGPFICAEWDFGGFPYWLNTKKDMKFRTYDELYLTYVDRYMDRIIPIIRKREIGEGGSVILVQVENEYGYLANDEIARDYMLHLRDAMLERGVTVPLITCVGGAEGTVEGANFWSGADHHYKNLVEKQPDTPKIVTEFWTGWFEHWGASSATQKTASLYEKRMLESLRAGFTGISHYMFFGGTNFGGYGGRTVGASDIFMVTSYDYDAPLSEYGRVTDKYHTAKRLSYFVTAIGSALLNAVEGDAASAALPQGFSARVRERGNERIWFVESSKDERETTSITLPGGRTIPVTVGPNAIVPVIDRLQLEPGVHLTCNTYLIANELIDGQHTLIVYAENGQRSYIELDSEQPIQVQDDGVRRQQLLHNGSKVILDLCHFQEAQFVQLTIGGKPYRIVAINKDSADRAWRIAGKSGAQWAIGYADFDLLADGTFRAALQDNDAQPVLLGNWGSVPEQELAPYVYLQAPAIGQWSSEACELSAAQGQEAAQPKAFSELGQPYGHLLYECEFEAGNESVTNLVISRLEDTARVYVNGVQQALVQKVGAAAVEVQVTPDSKNRLQILVQNMGRLNFSPFLGEVKGISGAVYAAGQSIDLLVDWKHEEATLQLNEVNRLAGGSTIRKTFVMESGYDRAVLVGAISGKLSVNGKEIKIEGYQDWFLHHTLDISDYLQAGQNVIEMAYVKSPLQRLELLVSSSAKELNGWRIADVGKLNRQAYSGGTGVPVWHTAQFDKPALPEEVNAKLKLRLTGMSKGTLWLNGINLGRYWQVGPQEDYKIPMAWLKDRNELVLFDENGASPSKVRLLYDQQSAKRWIPIL
ncbi:beta-galactosidase [Paenibacillus glycanilyticus]|uniref:beta-galactosidase n=1 Tax=Paenibacillus glycanilyticus TaxID=126569 RepID=UPI0020413B6F|nr:beta-galactosidase [Paenibacillus glycanilyticus]MCM3626636.1 beta-galactosidase [Paenibacillus glycanilyticus]